MKFGIRELLFFGLLAALPVGSWFWIFKPAKENCQKQQETITAKEKKLTRLSKATASIDNLSAEVNRLAEAVGFFESKLPGQHEIHKILAQVTKIADSQRLETHLFKTLKPKPFANYSEQPIQMNVYGDFDSYYQFLLEVEKLPRITKIQKMSLEKDPDQEGAMNAKFTLSIFFDHNNEKTGSQAG